jgi:ribonucleoside-triphosphate reductase (thioredoxin)
MTTMTTYQQVIHKSRYARFINDESRRENWNETVSRFVDYLAKQASKFGHDLNGEKDEIYHAVYNLEVMPSMRLLMTSGEACDRDNISAYNCAYVAVNNKRVFSETLYVLMNGTGVGFSCERQEVNKLPAIPVELKPVDDVIVVGDSKLGWAKAFKKLLSSLWEGDIPQVDYSKVRPAGARLKVFGGRASGPEPLKRLFSFVTNTFKNAAGRKLTSLEVHDIMCMIGEIVVVGGVRRSALISLSNLSDRRMREAKMGAWWEQNLQRALANNSAVYTEKPEMELFMEEWLSLVKSKSGERGIFNRQSAQKQAAKWGRRADNLNYGCNPCSEIILRDKEFCNLTEIIVRPEDDFNSLKRKVRVAALIGTIQSTLTEFQFLSEEWKKNCEEERLLGVSMTGIMDNPVLSQTSDQSREWLVSLRDIAREVNMEYAEKLSIPVSAAITCVKPSGTVSELVGCAPGIHPRYSEYYIRSIRQDNKDPLTQHLKISGVKWEPAFGKEDSTTVFYFPQKAPSHSVYRNDRTAIEQLEHWLMFQHYWCEHKPSVTIYVKDHEWLEVGAWIYKNFDDVSGVSFLPHSDHTYQQAPFTECTKENYELALNDTPAIINWDALVEDTDNTTSSQELACVGGACTI